MLDLIVKETDGTTYKTNIKLKTEADIYIDSICIEYADLVDVYYKHRTFALGTSNHNNYHNNFHQNDVSFIRKDNHVEVIIALLKVKEMLFDKIENVSPNEDITTEFYHSRIELVELQETLGLTIFGD